MADHDMSVEQVAAVLDSTPTMIRRAIAEGRLHASLIDGAYRITEDSLAAYRAAEQRATDVGDRPGW